MKSLYSVLWPPVVSEVIKIVKIRQKKTNVVIPADCREKKECKNCNVFFIDVILTVNT